MTQKQMEEENKRIMEEILSAKEEFLEFYYVHSESETMERFGIRNKHQLRKILTKVGYDRERKKQTNVLKGRKSTLGHEYYVMVGRKSAETQRRTWASKSPEEMEAWRQLQIETHSTQEYRERMSEITKNVYLALPEEKRERMNASRSETMKAWWESLPEEERNALLQKQRDGGAGWNHERIRETIHSRYGVDNVSQIEELKPIIQQSIIKTCMERYGVPYTVNLPSCYNAIGSHGCNTKPNMAFAELLSSFPELGYTGTNGVDREFVLGKYRYDFKIGNTLIEINPTPTHNSTWSPFSDKPMPKYYHRDKSDLAIENGYRCIHVWDWDDPKKVVSLLLKRKTVYARECDVRKVPKKEAREFLDENHLQGYARCSVAIGLYHSGELVGIMTFGKPRYNGKADWELIRFCQTHNVIGGAERLFAHFVSEHNPKCVVSYCDGSKFTGTTYGRLGFSLVKRRNPSKHWYHIGTGEHYMDTLIQSQGFSRIVHHVDASEENLDTDDNRTLMIREGFVEVYDCGQSTYMWTR